MTPEERIESVFELSEFQFEMMHAAAMHCIGATDAGEAWKQVRRGLDRLARAHDHGFYSSTKP